MNRRYRIIKGYQKDDKLRKSFNSLAKSIFSLNFEPWYEQGYWQDNYIPYSILDGERVVANVSISPMKFVYSFKEIQLIQLGTVMTDPFYRNQGLIRQLMREIERNYEKKTDGYFLFANKSVFEFYPKFGYEKIKEYEYFKDVNQDTERTAENISIKNTEERRLFEDAIRTGFGQSIFYLKDNLSLTIFYIINFMSQNIYKIKSEKAYAIAQIDNEVLYLYDIIAGKQVDLDKIIGAFGREIKRVILGFTPLIKEGYGCKVMPQIEDTLFVKGDALEIIEKNHLRFPVLSHT